MSNPTGPSPPVALVTGAARRIGAAIARRLHADGFDVALHFHQSAAEAQALAAELERARSGSVLLLQAELSEFDRLPELVAHAVGRFGKLDALVNNASAFFPTPLGSTTPAQWDALFASNVRATGSAACVHNVYIAADGCKPSAASISAFAPCSRDTGVMSTNATPSFSHILRAAALNASISLPMVAASRWSLAAKGVTPQSGIDSTSTRPARPFACRIARCSSVWNSPP